MGVPAISDCINLKNPFTNKMAHVFTAPSDRIMIFVNDTSSVGSFVNVKNGASEIEELRGRDESEINADEYIDTDDLLQQDLLKLATWCAKWRIKLNPERTKVIIFSRSLLARKAELNLTLYGEPLKIYPQVKFLGIIFDSKLTFQKHFEDVLERCNSRYHRLRLLANKKWGPSPATLIQIYKQCVRPIFEYGSLSTITASDNIISKIQRLQNKFIRLALRLPKYIIPRLLHDSTGLPYVKDRLLTCATKSLDRIAQNPLVEASISSHRHNPGWDRFPTPLSVVRPGDS